MLRRVQFQKLTEALSRAASLLDGFRTAQEDAAQQGVFHLGEAGSIAFEAGLPGIDSDAVFKDVSDAVETWDMAEVRRLQRHVTALAESIGEVEDDRAGEEAEAESLTWECDWLQFGAATNEAKAGKAGDSHGLALMCGFVVGMMWHHPGPYYDRGTFREWEEATRDDPDSDVCVSLDTDYGGGTIVETVFDGYRENRLELSQWAVGRLARAKPWSSSYSGEEEELRAYFELEERSVEYAQNFGLRIGRSGDDSLRVPHSYIMQRVAVLSAIQERESEADKETEEGEC